MVCVLSAPTPKVGPHDAPRAANDQEICGNGEISGVCVDTPTPSCYWRVHSFGPESSQSPGHLNTPIRMTSILLFTNKIAAFYDRDFVCFPNFWNEFVANEDEFFVEDIGDLGWF